MNTDQRLYDGGFLTSLNNFSYCEFNESKVLIVPNTALRILSIIFKDFNERPSLSEKEIVLKLETARVLPSGSSNYLALQNGLKFLIGLKKTEQTKSEDSYYRAGYFHDVNLSVDFLSITIHPVLSSNIKSITDQNKELIEVSKKRNGKDIDSAIKINLQI